MVCLWFSHSSQGGGEFARGGGRGQLEVMLMVWSRFGTIMVQYLNFIEQYST